jgi:hypothetical protein
LLSSFIVNDDEIDKDWCGCCCSIGTNVSVLVSTEPYHNFWDADGECASGESRVSEKMGVLVIFLPEFLQLWIYGRATMIFFLLTIKWGKKYWIKIGHTAEIYLVASLLLLSKKDVYRSWGVDISQEFRQLGI